MGTFSQRFTITTFLMLGSFLGPEHWSSYTSAIWLLNVLLSKDDLFIPWREVLRSPICILALGYLGTQALSLIWSENLMNGAQKVSLQMVFVGMVLVGERLGGYGEKIRKLWILITPAFLLLFMAHSIQGLMNSTKENLRYLEYFRGANFTEDWGNRIYASYFFGIALLFVLLDLLLKEKREAKDYILLTIMSVITGMLDTRMVIIAVLISASLLLMVQLKRKKITFWRATQVFGLMIGPFILVNLVFAIYGGSRFAEISFDDNKKNPRVEEWKAASVLIQEEPIFGYGKGDENELLYKQYEKQGFEEGVEMKYNVHNEYLQTFLAGGVFSFLFLAVFFLFATLYGYRNEYYPLALLVLFIGFCLITETSFERHRGVYFFGLALAAANRRR